jgi:hypothetical protein
MLVSERYSAVGNVTIPSETSLLTKFKSAEIFLASNFLINFSFLLKMIATDETIAIKQITKIITGTA